MDSGIYEDYPERAPEGGLEVAPQQYVNRPWAQQQQQQSYVAPVEKDTQPDLPVPQPTHDPAEAPGRIGGLKPVTFWCVIALVSLVVVGASVGGGVGSSIAARRSSAQEWQDATPTPFFTSTPDAFADSIAAAMRLAHATHRRRYMGPG